MKSVREVLERRWISRTLSIRQNTENARKQTRRGDSGKAAEFRGWSERHISACAEVEKIARDLGITLDTQALRRRVEQLEREAEQVGATFREDSP